MCGLRLRFDLQDFLGHGSDGLFTQGAFNDRTQDLPSTQNHFGLGGLQSQVLNLSPNAPDFDGI